LSNGISKSPYLRSCQQRSGQKIGSVIADFIAHKLFRVKRHKAKLQLSAEKEAQLREFLAPEIEALEVKRKQLEQETRPVRKFIIPVIAIVSLIAFPYLLLGSVVLGGSIIAIVYMRKVLQPSSAYQAEYKRTFVPQIAAFVGQLEYDAEGHIPMNKLEKSYILPTYNRNVYQEDYFRTTRKGTQIEIVECELMTRGSKNNISVFDGLMVLISLDSHFTGTTVVQTDFGLLNYVRKLKLPGKQRVKLEEPEFEKKFNVFSTNEIEARYLLTPGFMRKLLAISNIYNSTAVEASFFESQLLLMIYKADDFLAPPSITQPVKELPGADLMYSQLKSIFEIIETLDMKKDIG
jgi:uncharacterized protein DUF3137